MEDFTRKDIERIIEILRENTAVSNTSEKEKLAKILEDADIIPNMMIATYVKSVNRTLKTIKIQQNDELDGETINGLDNHLNSLNFDHINFAKSKLEAVNTMFRFAEDRQEMICDFEDSKHPKHITGRCQYENHYEDKDVGSLLTEDEMKEFDKLNETENWFVACEKFQDKLNPEDQELTITLQIEDDQHKYNDGDPEYVCETCLEEIADNCEGYASCDMEEE